VEQMQLGRLQPNGSTELAPGNRTDAFAQWHCWIGSDWL